MRVIDLIMSIDSSSGSGSGGGSSSSSSSTHIHMYVCMCNEVDIYSVYLVWISTD